MAREHLLLVERDAKTRRLLKVSLEQAGYSVDVARDGEDAWARLMEAPFDLVLTATHLPKLDGYGLVRKLKEDSELSSLPIIFLVDTDSIEAKIRGLELGVEEYLGKPVFVKELLSRVQVLLAKQVRMHLSSSVLETRVQGRLVDMPAIDLLESLESGRQSGIIRMRSGDREGVVYYQDGEIVDARLRRLRGEEVVYRLLTWTSGTYEVELRDIDVEPSIDASTRAVIEGGMRHAAEFQRLRDRLPPLHTVMKVNSGALLRRADQIPDEIRGIIDLVDGKRSLYDVLDESPFDDLSTLDTVAKLYGQDLLSVVAQGTTALDRSATPLVPADAEEGELPDSFATMRPPNVSSEGFDGVADAAARAATDAFRSDAPKRDQSDPDLTPRHDDGEGPLTPPRGGVPSDGEAAAVQDGPKDRVHLGATSEGAYAAYDEGDFDPASEGAGSLGEHERSTVAIPSPPAPPAEGAVAASAPEPATAKPMASDAPGPLLIDEADGGPYQRDPALDDDGDLHDDGELDDVGGWAEEFERTSAHARVEPFDDLDERELTASSRPTPEDSITGESHPPPPPRPDLAALRSNEATFDSDASSTSERADRIVSSERGRDSEAPDSEGPDSDGPDSEAPDSEQEPDSARDSDPTDLSESGVADDFFARPVAADEEGYDDIPESDDEPAPLTEAQIARQDTMRKVVMAVVGLLAGLVIFALVRGRSPSDASSDLELRNSGGTEPSTPTPAPPSSGTNALDSSPAPVSTAPAGEGGGAPAADESEDASTDMEGVGGAAVASEEDPMAKLRQLVNAGVMQKAIAYGRAAIAKEPQNADAYYLLGEALRGTGRGEDARDVFDRCVEKDAKGQYARWCVIYASPEVRKKAAEKKKQ